LRISTELKIASFFAGYPEIESPEQQTGILQGPDKRIQKRKTAKNGVIQCRDKAGLLKVPDSTRGCRSPGRG